MSGHSSTWHRLSSLDPDLRTASCSICGPVARFQLRDKKQAMCPNARNRWSSGPGMWERQVWAQYKIRPFDFALLLVKQDHRCAICRSPESEIGKRSWAIDHDHSCCPGDKSCGRCVRGLLCTRCNVGLAMFRDDPAALKAALSYIQTHES